MATPAWILKLVKVLYPQRFRLARLTRLPLVNRLTKRLLFNGDEVVYLPATQRITIQANIAMESVVLPETIVEHFIRQATDLFLMHKCVCRSANECQCYPVETGCLFLGKAVHNINPKFGRVVNQEEALAHAVRARQAGLVHTVGRSKIDSLLLGAGPAHQLLTICHCCPCCCMWNILPDFDSSISNTIRRMPGLQVKVTGACIGCGACLENGCFVNAITLLNGQAQISDACRGCGRCLEACPQGAIEIHIQDTDFVDETIQRITNLVDLS